eukprot:TRINITY_DN7981_c0_g1_i3.p1 TRINITY_DN7981_c0_g1~~TRINITY_DN7981_c0_g1_i3.p1  ORF type:complete len:532 (+),score=72.89 TRINITY_DN7981_c0_g1_i3:83-1678(+)
MNSGDIEYAQILQQLSVPKVNVMAPGSQPEAVFDHTLGGFPKFQLPQISVSGEVRAVISNPTPNIPADLSFNVSQFQPDNNKRPQDNNFNDKGQPTFFNVQNANTPINKEAQQGIQEQPQLSIPFLTQIDTGHVDHAQKIQITNNVQEVQGGMQTSSVSVPNSQNAGAMLSFPEWSQGFLKVLMDHNSGVKQDENNNNQQKCNVYQASQIESEGNQQNEQTEPSFMQGAEQTQHQEESILNQSATVKEVEYGRNGENVIAGDGLGLLQSQNGTQYIDSMDTNCAIQSAQQVQEDNMNVGTTDANCVSLSMQHVQAEQHIKENMNVDINDVNCVSLGLQQVQQQQQQTNVQMNVTYERFSQETNVTNLDGKTCLNGLDARNEDLRNAQQVSIAMQLQQPGTVPQEDSMAQQMEVEQYVRFTRENSNMAHVNNGISTGLVGGQQMPLSFKVDDQMDIQFQGEDMVNSSQQLRQDEDQEQGVGGNGVVPNHAVVDTGGLQVENTDNGYSQYLAVDKDVQMNPHVVGQAQVDFQN